MLKFCAYLSGATIASMHGAIEVIRGTTAIYTPECGGMNWIGWRRGPSVGQVRDKRHVPMIRVAVPRYLAVTYAGHAGHGVCRAPRVPSSSFAVSPRRSLAPLPLASTSVLIHKAIVSSAYSLLSLFSFSPSLFPSSPSTALELAASAISQPAAICPTHLRLRQSPFATAYHDRRQQHRHGRYHLHASQARCKAGAALGPGMHIATLLDCTDDQLAAMQAQQATPKGVDIIPCPQPGQPAQKNGVDAFRRASMSSSPPAVPGMLSMSPTTTPSVFGTSIGSQTSSPAPDKEPKKEKEKGLYPSRVVLTSEFSCPSSVQANSSVPWAGRCKPLSDSVGRRT